ncbi:formyl transferase [Thalassotalea sp. G2M2-11]|uniref:formyl transferase n=1 Tax=Thalassotalea sp. G2M2-11 TaxID=2787627 RepID=UPI0019D13C63|nr:formyl transferase [Thalassotalea sp. G2M2-11]
MNILILSNKDIASNYALNLLLPQLKQDHDLHLWLSEKVGKNNKQPKQLVQLKFFEQNLFNQLLAPLMNASNITKFTDFEGFNTFLKAKVREENNINGSASIQRIKQIAPDLIISIRYGGILREACINIPTKGVINLHSGILPKYRGVMATFWAMLNGEPNIGTTLHTIDDGSIDTGKIIKVSKIPIKHGQSYLQHTLELYQQGVEDIIDATNTLSSNDKLSTTPQAQTNSYFTFPSAEDLVQFEQKGLTLVNEQAYLDFIRDTYFAANH